MYPLVRLAIAVALLVGCSGTGPRVLVSLDGEILPSVSAFRVTGQTSDADPMSPATLNNSIEKRFNSFFVQLPSNPQGVLHLQVDGLRQGDCAILRGTSDTPVELAVEQGVTVSMSVLAEPECQLKLTVLGTGTVRCSALAPTGSASTGDGCESQFALGQKIRLRPEPVPGSVFLGWSGDCEGRADCEQAIRSQPIVATARFHSTRFCTKEAICWESPLPTGAGFLGLWSGPDGELWAVGQAGAILRREGGAFYPFESGTIEQFNAVWGNSKSDVWIVGTCGVVFHWDGSDLKLIHGGTDCENQPTWTSVWGRSSSDIWMVGAKGAVQHWNGSSFESLVAPVATDLNAVVGLADQTIVMVGGQSKIVVGNASGFTALNVPAANINLHAVGVQGQTIWAVGSSGAIVRAELDKGTVVVDQSATTSELYALYVTNRAVWAFGTDNTAIQLTDTGWHPFSTNAQTFGVLTAAAGASAEDFWVVGIGGIRLHWNGAYFVSEQGSSTPVFNRIRGVNPSNLWLSNLSELYRRTNGSIYRANLFVERLFGFLPLSGQEALLALGDGLARFREGIPLEFVCQEKGIDQLRAMDSSDPSYAYAVGSKGQILECVDRGVAGALWESHLYEVEPPNSPGLNSVWAAGLRNVFIVGEGAKVHWLHTVNGGLRLDAAPLFLPMNLNNPVTEFLSIHGSSPQNIWVGGPEGILIYLSFSGNSAGQQLLVTTRDTFLRKPEVDPTAPLRIRGVWARHEEDAQGNITLREAWAVGDRGLLFRARLVPGQPLDVKRFESGTTLPLYSVWGFGPDDVWVSGGLGTVLHYDPKMLSSN